ncbi:MAG TPA: hypothetical protein VNW92_07070, partial [Polyangiaceae bacterium]|nr:hypothetical protein [Polyangiaceae bacterium]
QGGLVSVLCQKRHERSLALHEAKTRGRLEVVQPKGDRTDARTEIHRKFRMAPDRSESSKQNGIYVHPIPAGRLAQRYRSVVQRIGRRGLRRARHSVTVVRLGRFLKGDWGPTSEKDAEELAAAPSA